VQFSGNKLDKTMLNQNPTEFVLPDWIGEYVATVILKDFAAKPEAQQKKILYGLGRLPLAEVQPIHAAGIPAQDEQGRYAGDVHCAGIKDEVMARIHQAQAYQETLSGILRRRPQRPFTFVPAWTPNEMERRIRARNWAGDAWGAGSHTGCDIYVLYMNVKMGLAQYRPAFEAAMAVCGALQSAEDGMWGPLTNPPFARVNGSMKVLSKVHFVQECHLPFADKMIDYSLRYIEEEIAAQQTKLEAGFFVVNVIDVLFCLKYAVRITEHRNAEVRAGAYALLGRLGAVRHQPGYDPGLFQGALRRAALLCGLKEALGWPEKVYRFPET
jgi:hypothetical protein